MEVKLYVYDLSESALPIVTNLISSSLFYLTPFEIEALRDLPHTSIAVYGHEIEYGKYGVRMRKEGDCEGFGNKLLKTERLGTIDPNKWKFSDIKAYVEFLNKDLFKGSNYNLLSYNCNTFTNFLAKQLVNKEIRTYVKRASEIALAASSICLRGSVQLIPDTYLDQNNKRKIMAVFNLLQTSSFQILKRD